MNREGVYWKVRHSWQQATYSGLPSGLRKSFLRLVLCSQCRRNQRFCVRGTLCGWWGNEEEKQVHTHARTHAQPHTHTHTTHTHTHTHTHMRAHTHTASPSHTRTHATHVHTHTHTSPHPSPHTHAREEKAEREGRSGVRRYLSCVNCSRLGPGLYHGLGWGVCALYWEPLSGINDCDLFFFLSAKYLGHPQLVETTPSDLFIVQPLPVFAAQ